MKIGIACAPLALAAALACMGGGSHRPETVAETDFGRLSPAEMQPVNAARTESDAARDGVARADLHLQEAQHEADYAKAEQTAVRADQERAAAAAKAAKESGDPGDTARAQELASTAQLHQQAAEAHAAYANQLVQARQAGVAAAKAEQARAEAALERAKLTALEQAQIPAATKYDPARFDATVAQRTREAAEARTRASQADHAALQALGTWQTLQQRWQARAQGPIQRG
ncbi:hypothetical protein [Anaeromyxobacter oryzae]|uniref:Lipoprotein n=1 Tax=Anaeromyxobacter oryzae TaxID=2918170 RepID=A0ABN6MRY4_9BACT|nr:hypothetical protein [Anaeromyxobacter oryzae]BDG03752.1 hypothetical protein AMOR_27480 [Anaeromyxobacter oryzae]